MNETTVHSKERVGIAGAGIVGLTSALLLADAGYEVTVVARSLPGDTSTQWSSPWCVSQHTSWTMLYMYRLTINKGRCSAFPPSRCSLPGNARGIYPSILLPGR